MDIITAKCDGCGWEGKEEELLDDPYTNDTKVFCPHCGTEGYIRKASNNWEEVEM